jgi:hypothetical protein
VSDIDTEAADSLKALDPKRPIREADMAGLAAGSPQSRMTRSGNTPTSISFHFKPLILGGPLTVGVPGVVDRRDAMLMRVSPGSVRK